MQVRARHGKCTGGVVTRPVRRERAQLRERNHIRSATLLFAACALTTVSACTSEGSFDKNANPQTSVTATSQPPKSVDPEEATKTEAINTYTSYWREMERAYAKGSSKGTALKDYAAGAALVSADSGIANMVEAGQLAVGKVTVGRPTVTQLDTSRQILNVKLSSCLDVSHWDVIDRGTRKPVALPTERLTKYVVVSVIEKWPDGWKVIKDQPQEKAC
ncbi:hypothetical protein [Streptomyces sp. NPDC056663]|uniref:hypothetical protein n=1 Tax=Streptomyces sp. NPDC056663 TaxID=3345899 RepID=UPI0036998A1F